MLVIFKIQKNKENLTHNNYEKTDLQKLKILIEMIRFSRFNNEQNSVFFERVFDTKNASFSVLKAKNRGGKRFKTIICFHKRLIYKVN